MTALGAVSGTNTRESSPNSPVKAEDQQTRFLKLLTTQLRNQDPLNPMDNAQTTSQLAQISTVTGIEKLNQTMSTLMGNNHTSDSLQAASLLGRSVLAPGGGLTLTKSMAVGGFELDKPANAVTVSVLDKNGQEVQRLELGAQKAGVSEFVWDGTGLNGSKLDDGQYSVKISAKDQDGAVNAKALELAAVNSVVTAGGEVKIDLGRLGRVSMDEIKLIL